MNMTILLFTQLSSITLCWVQIFSSFSAVPSITVQTVSRSMSWIHMLNWKMLRKRGKWQNFQTLPKPCPSAVTPRHWEHFLKTTYLRQSRQDQGRQQYLFSIAHHDVKTSKSMRVSEAILFSTHYQSLISLWHTAQWCSPWWSLAFPNSGSSETLPQSDIKATYHCLFLRKTRLGCCFFAREKICEEFSILFQSHQTIWASTNGIAAPTGPMWLLLRKIIANRN